MAWLDPSVAKVSIAADLFCGTMLFAAIPVLLSRRSRSHTNLLSGLSCLGGGVFLATCFLHLIPEAVEKMEDALKSSDLHPDGFPVAYAIIVAGFLLVLISDQLIQKFNKGQVQVGHGHGPTRDSADRGNVPNYGTIHQKTTMDYPVKLDEVYMKKGSTEASMEDWAEDFDDEDRLTTVSVHGDPGTHKPFRAIVLVFALSLHSFFEGLAVGLQRNTRDVVQLFGAIVVHKSVIAVSLATSLVSTTPLKAWGLFSAITVFSIMSPLGILAALPLNDAPALVVGVLQCIAAGTFVYVTFFEILPHELNSESTDGSRFFKTSMVLLGIGLMAGVMLAFPEDHEHDSHNETTATTTSPPRPVAPDFDSLYF